MLLEVVVVVALVVVALGACALNWRTRRRIKGSDTALVGYIDPAFPFLGSNGGGSQSFADFRGGDGGGGGINGGGGAGGDSGSS
jgi:hypothetical protein